MPASFTRVTFAPAQTAPVRSEIRPYIPDFQVELWHAGLHTWTLTSAGLLQWLRKSGAGSLFAVVNKLKCPVFVASEMSGFVNLP
jgi:hypothetical protein